MKIIKNFEKFQKSLNENSGEDQEILTIDINHRVGGGTRETFGSLYKTSNSEYYTDGQLGENTFSTCEEAMKYIQEFPAFGDDYNVFWNI